MGWALGMARGTSWGRFLRRRVDARSARRSQQKDSSYAQSDNRFRISKRETLLWLLGAVVVKGAYLLLLGGPPQLNGDAIVYIESIETLVTQGTYAWDLSRPETFAARMPGMILPYGFFRLWAGPSDSQALQQIFQAGLDSIAVVAMLLFAAQVGVGATVARGVALLYMVSTLVSSWNNLLLTESLATSGSFLGLWLCVRGSQARSWRHLGLGAVFLAWVGFLKAFYFGWIAVIALTLTWIELRRDGGTRSKAVRTGMAVILPFVLLASLWTIRNERRTGRLIPLQDGINGGYLYPPEFEALRSYMQAVGGDFVSWNPKAEVRWFDPWAGQRRPIEASFPPDEIDLSQRLATRACDARRLQDVRSAYRTAQVASDEAIRRASSARAAEGLIACRQAFIAERPFEYHLVAPIRLVKSYLGHSGTYNLFSRPFSGLTATEKAFKLFQSAIHLVAVSLGVLGACWVLLVNLRSTHFALPVAAAALGHTLGFPLILRLAEYRYLVMAYPLLLLCGAVMISEVVRATPLARGLRGLGRKGPPFDDSKTAT